MRRLILFATLAACGPPDVAVEEVRSDLTAAERRGRCEAIRDVANGRGLTNAGLLAGIGDAETGLAHCWSEATWACQGPTSPSCAGPVIAGAGDGPCSARQGGLGLFQFDGGTFEQTLARDGEEILLLEGNISHAVDFVLAMVLRSDHVAGIGTEEEALAWMNGIPIEPGHPDYEAWISTVTHYYNGCAPSYGCWEERRSRYDEKTRGVVAELGPEFWEITPVEPAPCAPIPPEGRVIEEDDPCYEDEGPASSWRTAETGHGGRLRWTYAFEEPEPANFAVWNLDFEVGGTYLVEVFAEGEFAGSTRARYTVMHDGVADERVIDQSSAGGFASLGELTFSAGGDQWIRLDDNTGEPLADRIPLAFDAIRLTPAYEIEPPVPPGPKDSDEPPELATPDAMGDAGLEAEGGCTCVRHQSASPVLLGVGLLLLATYIRDRSNVVGRPRR